MAHWNQTVTRFRHDDTLMFNDERDRLLEKLRGIEALYTGGATAGERSAAEAAAGGPAWVPRGSYSNPCLRAFRPFPEHGFGRPGPNPWHPLM